MRRTLQRLDRLMEWILRKLHADLCAVCAHGQVSHSYDRALDANYCSRCRMGEDLHTFEEQERRTLR